MLFYYKILCFVFLVLICAVNSTNVKTATEEKIPKAVEPKKQKVEVSSGGAALVFAEELRQILERHLLGQCPQTYKMSTASPKLRNTTSTPCDGDVDNRELAARLFALSLRASSAAREGACAQLGSALAHSLRELAQAAAQSPQSVAAANASAEKQKARKLSKSQKTKLQAKQRTAIAVRKKAAALAAKQQAASATL